MLEAIKKNVQVRETGILSYSTFKLEKKPAISNDFFMCFFFSIDSITM